MSRIGKKLILLPPGVDATVSEHSVGVKGPKGTLTVALHPSVSVREETDPRGLTVLVKDETSQHEKALWGLSRQLISNAVEGVQKPFEKSLEFVGVGFKVTQAGPSKLNLEVGFSHPVTVDLPQGIEAKVDKQIVTIIGIDKQLVGEMAAQIRRIKKPEPYKGKGIKYTTEIVRRKAGKAATKAA